MKDPSEWDEEYILNLGAYETQEIDFKDRRFLEVTANNRDHILNELAKHICAFANSIGGVIVVGVSDPDPVSGVIQISNGGVPLIGDKGDVVEWLNNVIPTLLEFEVHDVQVYPVTAASDTSQIADGHAIILIDIPPSDQAPHQSKRDKHYYMRIGSSSLKAEHRNVVDMFNRRQHPIFDLNVKAEVVRGYYRHSRGIGQVLEPDPDGNTHIKLIFIARNIGRVYAQYISCFFFIPKELFWEDINTNFVDEFLGVERYTERNGKVYYLDSRTNLKGSQESRYYKPVLPKLATSWELEFRVADDLEVFDLPEDLELLWEIYADNSISTGEISLNKIEKVIKERFSL